MDKAGVLGQPAGIQRKVAQQGRGATEVLLQASYDLRQALFTRSHTQTPALGKEMNGPVTRLSQLEWLEYFPAQSRGLSRSICILTTSLGDPDGLGTTLRESPTRGLEDLIL